MADVGTMFQGAAMALKAAQEIVKVGIDAKVDAKASARTVEALGKLEDTSLALYAMRDELFRLQEENMKLKREADKRLAFEARQDRYEITKTAGGAVVWRFKAEPEHYACPNCMNDGRIEILQDNRTSRGKYRCTVKSCAAEFPVDPVAKPPPALPINHPSGGGWMK